MNPKKAKEKQRRRARKLADQAWEVANEHNLDLAEKIIRRAVATQPENPVLWNDQGILLGLRSKEHEAEEAFRTAISLAPTFAEPFARLAEMRARKGHLRDAIRLMEQAVQHAPQLAMHATRLETYRALLACQRGPAEEPPPVFALPPETVTSSTLLGDSQWPKIVAALDWDDLGERLTRDGCVLIPALVDSTTCATIRGLFDIDMFFAKTVAMDNDHFGRGVYRYFKAPIPAIVDRLRTPTVRRPLGGFSSSMRGSGADDTDADSAQVWSRWIQCTAPRLPWISLFPDPDGHRSEPKARDSVRWRRWVLWRGVPLLRYA